MSDPAGVYIHIPFCLKKCAYCDFYSGTELSLIPDFLTRLEQEIREASPWPDRVRTLYFGGGTPSVLTPDQVGRLLEAVRQRFDLDPAAEITLEANPGTLDRERAAGYRALGINRISIGVQSVLDDKLTFLGRIHDAVQAVQSVKDAAGAGFERISLDLIYGLDREAPERWLSELDQVLCLPVDHLSCYMLTVEPGTPLHDRVEKGRSRDAAPDLKSTLFRKTALFLSEKGWDHYEVSSFARTRKHRSRHNSAYWQMRPYYGFGPGAHSFLDGSRSWNHADTARYIRDLAQGNRPEAGRETPDRQARMTEQIMLGLRTRDGIDIRRFEADSGVAFKRLFRPLLELLEADGLARWDRNDGFSLTLQGQCRLDSIVRAFVDRIC